MPLRAFGAGEEQEAPLEKEIREDLSTPLLQKIADYLKGLWDNYVLTPYFNPIFVSLAVGASTVVQTRPSRASMLTVSVTAGQIDIWMDNRSGQTTGTPFFRFTAVGFPCNVPLPPNTYEITILNSGAVTATACVLPSSA